MAMTSLMLELERMDDDVAPSAQRRQILPGVGLFLRRRVGVPREHGPNRFDP
jgi:hypothetical protein